MPLLKKVCFNNLYLKYINIDFGKLVIEICQFKELRLYLGIYKKSLIFKYLFLLNLIPSQSLLTLL